MSNKNRVPKGLPGPKLSAKPKANKGKDQAAVNHAEQAIMQQLADIQDNTPSLEAAQEAHRRGDTRSYLREMKKYGAQMQRLAAHGTALENQLAKNVDIENNAMLAFLKRHTGLRK